MSKKISEKRNNEIHDRLIIGKHIINKIKESTSIRLNASQPLKSVVSQYTGVTEDIVEKALMNKNKKTFTDWYNFNKGALSPPILRFEDVRQVIVDHYVNQLQIPNKKSIFEALSKLERYKNYSALNLPNDLYYIGFKWKRLPNSKKYIVVEKSEQFMTRMRYFQRMKEYRSNNRVLIHVERTSVKCPQTAGIVLAACLQMGIIACYQPSQSENTDSWLKPLINEIPKNSVFVMQLASTSEGKMDTFPNVHSRTDELIKWLDAHNIPHGPNQHNAELYALIQKYKHVYPPTYNFVSILEAAGHEVVIRPPQLSDSFFDISDKLSRLGDQTSEQIREELYTIFNEYSSAQWLEADRKMATKEMLMYEEDQKLELILDNLMDKINDGCMCEEDFEECDGKECDVEFLDRLCLPYEVLQPRLC
ncbi:hypothetical protein HF086_016456 [Spodoptera exigua]|uniref:Uncharacterized protein n=1 Tax=Spodoptera exigua TaxID=7107 RepID=A0A922SNJ7_SPOEX|nr:hypothetical protein HF086_016456 [Spodoptera exigua]